MNPPTKTEGPRHHRILIWLFSALLGLLVYWLLGFLIGDIGSWPGPVYRDIEKALVEEAVLRQRTDLDQSLAEVNRAIAAEKARQAVLRDGTDNSSRTMGQLIEVQKMNLERNAGQGLGDMTAFREAQQLFLASQKEYQASHEKIARLTQQIEDLETRKRELDQRLETLRQPARVEYERLHTRHQLKMAAGKLAILLPLLAVAVLLFLRHRSGLYAPAIHAFGVATLLKVILVMHEHFPRRYFKYLLLVAALLLVARILVYLVRAVAAPRREWLLRKYRDAYEHFFCPVCEHPIRRGPLRYSFWTRRSLKRVAPAPEAASGPEVPYVCPVCSTRLFEECPACHAIRHSLLPACSRCGAEKAVGTGAGTIGSG